MGSEPFSHLRSVVVGCSTILLLAASLRAQDASTLVGGDEERSPVATFSIVGFDPETGEIGVAVQSRVFSVGNGVIWGEAGVPWWSLRASCGY